MYVPFLDIRLFTRRKEGAHKNVLVSKHHKECLRTYVEIIEALHRCNGVKINDSHRHFQSRKIFMNKCEGSFDTKEIFDCLFQKQ